MPNPRYFKYLAQGSLGVEGPDALEFLQGQFSNDLSSIEVGQVVYGLWLNRKGKIVADSFVLRLSEECFRLVSYFCDEETIYDRLDSYLIMEDAEIERSSELRQGLCVLGRVAQERTCECLGLSFPKVGSFSMNAGVVAFWGRRCGEPALEVLSLDHAGAACIGKIDADLFGVDGLELRLEDMAALAIRSRIPLIGMGFGELDLPQELGLENDAVSFRKGCYLGQEVMARIHAMGRVRKSLKIVSIENSNTLSNDDLPVDLLDDSGKRQGQLKLVAYPGTGGIGLAVVSSGCQCVSLSAGEMVVRLIGEERLGV